MDRGREVMGSLAVRIAEAWCRLTHPAPMWPVHGRYQCPKCLRTYPVPWDEPKRTARVIPLPVRRVEPQPETGSHSTQPAVAVASR